MWVHYLLSAILCISHRITHVKSGNKNKKYLAVIFFFLFIFAAFRAFNIGNDTREYFRIFNLIRFQDNFKSAISITRYEPGFLLFYYFIGKITDNYTFVLIIVTAFYLYSSLRFFNRYATNIPVAIFLFFSFSLYYDVYNIQRQCIALAIFLFSVDFLIERKPIPYFILIALCVSFHITSVILVVLYFLPKADFNRISELVKWIAVILAFSLMFNFAIQIFISIFPFYAGYFQSAYSQGGTRVASVVFLMIRVSILGLLVLTRGMKKYLIDFNEQKNVFIQLALVDIIFASMSISFNLFDRLEVFFSPVFILCITNIMNELNLKNRMLIKFYSLLVSYMFLTATLLFRSNWYGIFPYSFFEK